MSRVAQPANHLFLDASDALPRVAESLGHSIDRRRIFTAEAIPESHDLKRVWIPVGKLAHYFLQMLPQGNQVASHIVLVTYHESQQPKPASSDPEVLVRQVGNHVSSLRSGRLKHWRHQAVLAYGRLTSSASVLCVSVHTWRGSPVNQIAVKVIQIDAIRRNKIRSFGPNVLLH